jgi:aminoglycoside/choline kinase family phosphotransferase
MSVHDRMVDFARKTLGLSQATEVELIPFAGRGSDRSYFRLQWSRTQSAVLVHYDSARRENAGFVDIAGFLESIEIPTARILGHDSSDCFIVMQDLGDIDLWSLRHSPWEKRRALYQKTLAVAQRLHSYPAQLFPADRITLAEAFEPALYRWEQDYFLENFVVKLCGIHPESGALKRLETELEALAERLSALPRCLIHRDLQSQNVMICGDEPFLIDFQGMRFGSLFYDLGSLLYDPYVALTENEREELLLFYFRLSEESAGWDSYRKTFMEASAQRLMQALGAYGFLGIARGLKHYLNHVRPGLENLRLAVRNAGLLPCLQELAYQCMNSLDSSS